MAISPVDIRMMQRMGDVAQIKHHEVTRPEAQQTVITQDIQKNVQIKSEQIQKKEDADKSDTKHDAREKGKNSYFASEQKGKKKKEEQGKVTIKGNASFDMKI